MTTEDVYAVALNLLSAVVEAPSKNDAILDTHNALRELDEVALRRVAGCLAVEAVWSRLPTVLAYHLSGRDRDAGLMETHWRGAVRDWVDQLRLEVAWRAPDRQLSEEAT
ncbi:hypothetical protein ACIA49_03555 [Kribbella sp. NPDC051587]|uniref:hypothetical protein n=1 Tax=Kribbella sp. NPDC051587 TaxID=3364119 RepID=UPI00378E7A24